MASSSQLPPAPRWSASSQRLLRFSPLAQSADSGSSWVPAFLPGALAPRARRPRLRLTVGADRIAERRPSIAAGRIGLSSWSPLVTASTLSRVSPDCGVRRRSTRRVPAWRGAADRRRVPARRASRPVHADRRTWQSAGLTLGGSLRRSGHHRAAGAVDGRGDDRARPRQPGWPARLGGAVAERQRTVDRGQAAGSRLPGRPVRSTAVNSAGDVAVLLGVRGARVRPSRSRRQEHGPAAPPPREDRGGGAAGRRHSPRADRISMPSRWTASRSGSSR